MKLKIDIIILINVINLFIHTFAVITYHKHAMESKKWKKKIGLLLILIKNKKYNNIYIYVRARSRKMDNKK